LGLGFQGEGTGYGSESVAWGLRFRFRLWSSELWFL